MTAERFMARWHISGGKSSERCAAQMRGARNRKGGGGGREIAIQEGKETADKVARHQTDYVL